MTFDRKKPYVLYILLTISGLGYYYFGYLLYRANFYELFGIYSLLFGVFIWMTRQYSEHSRLLWVSSLIFRFIFILAIPSLSQDFYRFIWDGQMILEGLNPYLYTPASFLQSGELPIGGASALIDGMGSLSAGNYTNYPPLNQLSFAIATLFSGGSVIGSVFMFRLMIIAADLGTIFFGKKMLNELKLPESNILWYALNPFIIIELTGNLHFEGVMIFFLVCSLYLLHKGNWLWSAVLLSCSISIKLIPLIFLPLFLQKLRFKSIQYYFVVSILTVLFFLPFYSSEFVSNFSDTIALWFQKFEFNASLYYIAREIGYSFRGYNEIAIIGSYIPYIVIGFIMLLTVLRNNRSSRQLISAMLLGLTFYFFTSTTVHPWYIATLLALGIFTRYRFALAWSFVVMLSYWAYSRPDFQENLVLIAVQYGIVFSLFLLEIFGVDVFGKLKASSTG